MKKAYGAVVPLIIPILLVIIAFLVLKRLEMLSPGLTNIVKFSPYIILAAAAILSWRFNKSRAFFIVLVLAAGNFFISDPSVISAAENSGGSPILASAALLIPVNILLFTFLKDRGVFTVWGLINAALVCLQPAIIFYLLQSENKHLLSFSTIKPFPVDFKIFNVISQPSAIVFLIVFVIVIMRYISGRSYLDAANIGILSAVFLAFSLFRIKLSAAVFFAFSGLIMFSALIQEFYSMAFQDELTGLPSRRSLKYELMKLSGKYTIAMLDIDFFKKFNDTYGHDTGDQVLKMVARCIKEVKGGGKPFRYGGEEFTVLFPGKSLREAFPHLEELREAVSKKGFIRRSSDSPKSTPKNSKVKVFTGKQLYVTISIGAAEKNEKFRLPDDVIKGADNALYRAKKKGRNCVSK